MQFSEIVRSTSSSASDSSRAGSPDTRATTPSSDCQEHTYLPTSYAHLRGDSLTVATLVAILSKHSSSNRIGLIIGDSFMNHAVQDEWTSHCEGSSEYFVSSSYMPTESQIAYNSTDPTEASRHNIFSLAALRAILSIPINDGNVLHVLEKPAFAYPPLSDNIAKSLVPSNDGTSGNIPTVNDWKTLWANWDLITLKMIPSSMLHQKPIDLRHKCLFYIGHIPTFLDMLINKSIGGEPTEPKHFWSIFERGIDPHVDDPDHCHNHSDVPEKDEDWPTLDAIIGFRNGVRQRLLNLYDDLKSGRREMTRNIARTLVMTHEHEAFHIETLLYMLIQRAGTGTLPPPGFTIPAWPVLSTQWAAALSPSTSSVLVPRTLLTMGHDDSEADDLVDAQPNMDVKGHTFGWDNESPARIVEVGAFRADWRCVTNGEFKTFWQESKGAIAIPASWVEEDGEFKIRTMYGPVPMHIAEHWPVLTAYDDLESYAKSRGGRLPTEPELRLFLDLYDVGHEGGANAGFRHWHPVPGSMGLEKYGGKGSNGGVWEWTSTLLDTHEGFVPTNLFTGYSEDFFDFKHHISLGASYATLPRLAGRRTVRNFYQHNYPYPWIGARVVYDV
ncbi:DUF323 domain-containing protein [Crepidotus variabilis]|uniref:DUF323 domain-containing protein n=1 Tax=Crepidotus variabilis TaxID=179855 RepID=A0A9P6EGE8_9AGAR|nr:DUF323 domain-containing protein [Crepidotus variabilis]